METMTQGHNLTLPVYNLQISYDDVGEGNIPVIFLHGYPFDKSMWQGQLDFLQKTHRLIAIDIRGFGESTDEESYLSMDTFGNDLMQFMDKLGLEKAIICGLSMGGYIALNVVKRFPEKFKALILCDTQCIADTPEAKTKRFKTIGSIDVNGVEDFNEGFIKNIFHQNSLTDKKEVVEEVRTVVYANSKHIIKQGLVALAERNETCSTLGDIKMPTLILCGREDKVTPLEQSEFMHETIKGSVLHVIDDAGHVSNLEQPEVFNKHLLDFLNGL
ncbi:MAG: alpha/beta hydrolase [Saprospiraceae bacterium]|nr:alpha/beta hydrolase [Saprospiraceae bacterium]